MESGEARAPRKRGRPRSFDRDAALERAMLVFWERGYEGTAISDLTAALGINPPSLYAAFGDKQRLFLEAVQRYSRGPGAIGPMLVERAGTARDAIARVLEERATELTRATHPRGCMVVTSALSCSDSAAAVRRALAEHRVVSEASIRARIRRGAERGELERSEVATLAKFVMTVVQGMSVQARDGASRQQLRALAALTMRVWPDSPRRTLVRPSRRAARVGRRP